MSFCKKITFRITQAIHGTADILFIYFKLLFTEISLKCLFTMIRAYYISKL